MAGRSNGYSKIDGLTVPKRILKLLSDGRYHSIAELRTCLYDDLAVPSAIHYQVCMIRKELRAKGEDIVCHERGGVKWYMHIRIVSINS